MPPRIVKQKDLGLLRVFRILAPNSKSFVRVL